MSESRDSPELQQSLDRIKAACLAYVSAEAAYEEAKARRTKVLREEAATVGEVGPTRVARHTGGAIGEGTVRNLTQDLPEAQVRRRRRPNARTGRTIPLGYVPDPSRPGEFW